MNSFKLDGLIFGFTQIIKWNWNLNTFENRSKKSKLWTSCFARNGTNTPNRHRYYKPTQTLQKYQTSNTWTAFDSTLSQIGSQSYIIQFRSIFLGRWRASAVLKLRFISHYFFLEQLFWTGTEMVWGWLLRLQMKWVVRKNSKEATSMHDFKNMDFTGNMLRLKLLPF